MQLKNKGQVSFEVLLITAIIFAMVIWVSSYYLQIRDSTLALQLTKIHTIKQIEAADGKFTISNMDFREDLGDNTIVTMEIGIEPSTTAWDCATEFYHTVLCNQIIDETKYETVTIKLNGNSCPVCS